MRSDAQVRVVQIRTDIRGALRFAADLATATRVARWAAAGAPVRLRTGAPAGNVGDWAGALGRGARALLVLTEPGRTPTAEIGCAVPGARTVCVEALDEALASEFAGVTPSGAAVSPYTHGILDASHAVEAGVHALTDLPAVGPPVGVSHLAGIRPALAVHGLPLAPDASASRTREKAVRTARALGWEPVVVLTTACLTSAVAERLVAAGVTRVHVDVLDDGTPGLRATVVVAASAGLLLDAAVDLRRWSGPDIEVARRLSLVVRTWPATQIEGPAHALRRLTALGALSGVRPDSELARLARWDARRRTAARARLVEGRYPDVPLVSGPHDVWWDHRDDPGMHRTWLSALVPAGGHLHTHARHDVSAWEGGIPLSDHRPIVDYATVDPEDGESLAFLGTPGCVAAFLSDAERAWHTGDPPPRFTGRVGGLCRAGGPCWSDGGRRLYVDPDGVVRSRPAGPAVGAVGDPFPHIRRQIRQTRAACCSSPPKVPWIGRVLAARSALRSVAGQGGATASGWGGPLLHRRPSAHHWPEGVALVQWGGGLQVHDTRRGTSADLNPLQALTLETSLDLGESAASLLTSVSGMPFTTELVTQVAQRVITGLSQPARDLVST